MAKQIVGVGTEHDTAAGVAPRHREAGWPGAELSRECGWTAGAIGGGVPAKCAIRRIKARNLKVYHCP